MDRNRRYGRSTFSATVYRGARWIAEELTSIHFAGIVVCFHSLCVSFRSTLYDSELLGTKTLKSRIYNRHRFPYGSVCSISSIESDLLVIQYTALTHLTKKVLPLTLSVLKNLFNVVFRPLHRNPTLNCHESTLDLFRSWLVTTLNTFRMSVSEQPTSTSSTSTNAATTQTATMDDNVKVRRPDLYYGNWNQLEDWIMQLEIYFGFNTIPANRKSLFAVGYPRGKAQQWIKPNV